MKEYRNAKLRQIFFCPMETFPARVTRQFGVNPAITMLGLLP